MPLLETRHELYMPMPTLELTTDASRGITEHETEGRIARMRLQAGNIGRATKQDIAESDCKLLAMASLVGVIAVEAVGISRAPSILAIPAAVKVQKETGIPVISGMAAGALYGSWCLSAAHVLNNGINHLPKTFEAAGKALPNVDKVSSILPGLDAGKDEGASVRAGRGLAVYSTGTALYVTTAGLQEQTRQERKKLCNNLGRDGGAFLGGLAMVATGAVMLVETQNPKLGDSIMEYAGNSEFLLKALLAITAGKLALKWAAGKLRKQKEARVGEPLLSS